MFLLSKHHFSSQSPAQTPTCAPVCVCVFCADTPHPLPRLSRSRPLEQDVQKRVFSIKQCSTLTQTAKAPPRPTLPAPFFLSRLLHGTSGLDLHPGWTTVHHLNHETGIN